MSASLALRALRRSSALPTVSTRSFRSTAHRHAHFLNANAETFQKAISNKDNVVLVDFYADWCNPCKMLSPILEKLTTDTSVKSGTGRSLDLVTVDTEVEIELARKYQIRSLPTVIAFRDGQPISKFMGALPEPSVRNFLAQV